MTCLGYYNIDPQLKSPAFNLVKPFEHEWCLPRPLKSQVFRWFREKHKLFPEIASYTEKYMDGKVKFNFEIRDNGEQYEFEEGPWISYEEAESACIDKLIEIVKNGTEINT